MKKLKFFLTPIAVLLLICGGGVVFTNCSTEDDKGDPAPIEKPTGDEPTGDETIIDLTGYCIIGSVLESGWKPNGKAPLIYNEADGTYSATVTATGTGTNSFGRKGDAFAIIQIDDSSWSTAYRLDQPGSSWAAVFESNGGTRDVYQGSQSPDCMIIPGTKYGDEINILIKPSTTYISVTVSIDPNVEPPLTVVATISIKATGVTAGTTYWFSGLSWDAGWPYADWGGDSSFATDENHAKYRATADENGTVEWSGPFTKEVIMDTSTLLEFKFIDIVDEALEQGQPTFNPSDIKVEIPAISSDTSYNLVITCNTGDDGIYVDGAEFEYVN